MRVLYRTFHYHLLVYCFIILLLEKVVEKQSKMLVSSEDLTWNVNCRMVKKDLFLFG